MKKKYCNISEKNGISLITLSITIIVLLILTGVSFITAINGDGILGRTNTVYVEHDIAKAKDELDLVVTDIISEYYRDETKYMSEEDVVDYVIKNITTKSSGNSILQDYTITTDQTNYKITATNKKDNGITATGELREDGSIKW